jgi:hypothetical protein
MQEAEKLIDEDDDMDKYKENDNGNDKDKHMDKDKDHEDNENDEDDSNRPPKGSAVDLVDEEHKYKENDNDKDKHMDKDHADHDNYEDDGNDLAKGSADDPVDEEDCLNDDTDDHENYEEDDDGRDDPVDVDHLEGASAARLVIIPHESDDDSLYDGGHDTTQRYFVVHTPGSRRGPNRFQLEEHTAIVNGKEVTAYLYKVPEEDPLYDY